MSAVDTVNEAFQSLFFGEGAYLGFLVYFMIQLAIMMKYKYAGVILVPINIFIALEYISQDMGWLALGTFFLCAFIMIFIAKSQSRGGK